MPIMWSRAWAKTTPLTAMSKIKRFKKEAFPKILVSVNMLDTGFDCPEVVNLVFARFTKSAILYQQMRGRGTRKLPTKPVFTMFDFVGVCDYHGDDDELSEGGRSRSKKEKEIRAAQTARSRHRRPYRPDDAGMDHHRRKRQNGLPRGLGAKSCGTRHQF